MPFLQRFKIWFLAYEVYRMFWLHSDKPLSELSAGFLVKSWGCRPEWSALSWTRCGASIHSGWPNSIRPRLTKTLLWPTATTTWKRNKPVLDHLYIGLFPHFAMNYTWSHEEGTLLKIERVRKGIEDIGLNVVFVVWQENSDAINKRASS